MPPPIPPAPAPPPPGGVGGVFILLDAITSSILSIIEAASVADLIICSLTAEGSYTSSASRSPTFLQERLLRTTSSPDRALLLVLLECQLDPFLHFQLELEVLIQAHLHTFALQAALFLRESWSTP